MLQLYPDQQEVMDDLRNAMRRYKSILLQSSTGAGKTAMATDMTIKSISKGNTVLFSVPRRDLMNQTSETFRRYHIPHSFISAGKDFNPYSKVYIGTVDTLYRRLDRIPKINLAIYDETHYGREALGAVISATENMGAWNIGLSATPWRMDGSGLGNWYRHMVLGKSTKWLIANKRLSKYRYFYGKRKLDLSDIKVTGGDYNKGDLAGFMEDESKRYIIGDCVKDYKERCMGKIHLVRCTSIKHSNITAEAFRDAGISAMHVDGETPDDVKRQIFRDYALRKISVLTFADLLNFGFDLSQASGGINVCVESGSDQKPTMSLAGFLQWIGRLLRYKEEPAIINDYVNNWQVHGLPCADREWTLESRIRKATGEKAPPTKQCPQCYCIHEPALKCPECGYTYPAAEGRQIKQIDGELVEMDIDSHESIRDGFSDILPPTPDEQTLEYLIKLAQRENRPNPVSWAAKELAKRMQFSS